MHRVIPILLLFGLIWLLPAFLLRDDGSRIAVMYSGSAPVLPEGSGLFEGDCALSYENGLLVQGENCEAPQQLIDGFAPKECDVTLAFMPMDKPVTRLRAKVIVLKDGAEIGRGVVDIDTLAMPNRDNKWVTASFRSECGAERLQLIEATALVDGEPTNLIGAQLIRATGVVTWLPIGSLITIGETDS